jgi:hypothetical protein
MSLGTLKEFFLILPFAKWIAVRMHRRAKITVLWSICVLTAYRREYCLTL